MMGMAPNSTPADEAGVFALLALLTDVNRCTQRARELHALSSEAGARLEELRALEVNLREREQTVATKALEVGNRARTVEGQAAKLAEDQAAFAARSKTERRALDEQVKAAAATAAALAQRERAIESRQAALDEREERLRAREHTAAAREQEYQDKLNQLSAIVGR